MVKRIVLFFMIIVLLIYYRFSQKEYVINTEFKKGF